MILVLTVEAAAEGLVAAAAVKVSRRSFVCDREEGANGLRQRWPLRGLKMGGRRAEPGKGHFEPERR